MNATVSSTCRRAPWHKLECMAKELKEWKPQRKVQSFTSPPRPPAQASWGLAQVPSTKSSSQWLEPPVFGVHLPPPTRLRLILPHLSAFVFWTPSLFAFPKPPPPPYPPLPPPPRPTSLPAFPSCLPCNRQVTFEETVGAVETPVFLPQPLGFCCGHAPTLPTCPVPSAPQQPRRAA